MTVGGMGFIPERLLMMMMIHSKWVIVYSHPRMELAERSREQTNMGRGDVLISQLLWIRTAMLHP